MTKTLLITHALLVLIAVTTACLSSLTRTLDYDQAGLNALVDRVMADTATKP